MSMSITFSTDRPSLESISKRYGQYETFGHKDYEKAKEYGYTDEYIRQWLDQDIDNRLTPDNRPGGSTGLYDEIAKGKVDPTKAVNIDRGYEPEGMTPFEYDYQKTLDVANIDKQINQMQLESAENIQKLSNRNKLSLASMATNQSILTGLVGALNF